MKTHSSSVNDRLEALELENRRMKTRLARASWRFRVLSGVAAVVIVSGILLFQAQPASAQGGGGNPLAARVAALETAVAALQAKTQYVSVEGHEMTITGANLHVVNGMGGTETVNGLGNLIVGYNEAHGGGLDVRTGSHNIVMGYHSQYSSYAGLVAGFECEIHGPYSTVTGGYGNIARGSYCSVTGGALNKVDGYYSSISGGENLTQDSNWGWSGGGYHTP
jgi:hypothetical protein